MSNQDSFTVIGMSVSERWLQHDLREGDGAAIERASAIDLRALEDAELILFDLA